MADCRYCENAKKCPYKAAAPDVCDYFEETFEHHWKMMDDIEREEYNALQESEVSDDADCD